MRLQLLFGCLLTVALVSFTVVAKRKLMANKGASTVTYDMKHPLHKWQAVSHDLNCAMIYDDAAKQIETVAVSIKVASFDSKDGNRDSHALEVLDALKYPAVTFVSESIQPGANDAMTINGKLTFHGVPRPVVIQATRQDAGNRLTITGNFMVSLTEHNVERPSLMGMKTDDSIAMTFTAVFNL